MNILAIGAHFDDVELGCGGALARHAREGDDVFVYVPTLSGFAGPGKQTVRTNETALKEANEAMRILGIKKLICGEFETMEVEFCEPLNVEIVRIVEDHKIDKVYTHWVGDIHHDHQAVSRGSLHGCRHVPRMLMYRSNWYHSTLDFRGNYYVDITDYWDIKEKAVRAHASEMERIGNAWIDFFRNEAENAGQKIGVGLAEVFEMVKWLED